MKVNSWVVVALVSFLFTTSLLAQQKLQIGAWRDHLPTNSCLTLVECDEKIFAGSSKLGESENPAYSFFRYDTKDETVKSLSKVNGYSQSSVRRLGYSNQTKTLVVVYENGQMDLIRDDKRTVVNDLLDYQVVGSKLVNSLFFYANQVWISTDFGLVIYNLDKQEVTEVYQSFEFGNDIWAVKSSVFFNDSIFVATSKGLYVAARSPAVNKINFESWSKKPPLGVDPGKGIEYLAVHQGRLFVTANDLIVSYKDGNWLKEEAILNAIYQTTQNLSFVGFKENNGKLWFVQRNAVYSYFNGEFTTVLKDGPLKFARDVIQQRDGTIWIADKYNGLVTNKLNKDFGVLSINTPNVGSVYKMAESNGSLALVAGGYTLRNLTGSGNLRGNISILENGLWTSYDPAKGQLPLAYDLLSVNYNRTRNRMYFASFGSGLVELDNGRFRIMNDTTPGCPLSTCSPTVIGEFCLRAGSFCRVTDVTSDSKGDVWVLNHQLGVVGKGSLYRYDTDNNWHSYYWTGTDQWGSYNYSSNATAHLFPTLIHLDKYENKWIALASGGSQLGGVLVFNESYSKLPRYFGYVKDSRDELVGKAVLCMTSDLDGAVWLGTDNGVCYFPNPNEVFQLKGMKASIPVFENRALLRGELIKAIAVDGSNRKWIGTEKGVWLFSSDGSKLISHFDETNCPLPSNNILDIKISSTTGEVYFATEKGMVSYGGDALLGEETNTQVSAYPNPISREYTGVYTVSGLVNNAMVKITDVSGKLVYQTKAEGSLATWNVKDYTGRRVQPGIYLVFSSNENGGEALVSKVAIVD